MTLFQRSSIADASISWAMRHLTLPHIEPMISAAAISVVLATKNTWFNLAVHIRGLASITGLEAQHTFV
jgi:hypothetical protein